MGKRSRSKGVAWELHCSDKIAEAGKVDVDRVLSESREGNIGDLIIPPKLPISVQCGVGARPAVWQKFREACESAEPRLLQPVALLRLNGRGGPSPIQPVDVAVLDMEDWLAQVALNVAHGIW